MVSLSSIIISICGALFSWSIYLVYVLTYRYNPSIVSYFMWFNFGSTMSLYFPLSITIATALLIIKHKENIKRIKAGTESKIKWMK